MKSIKKRFRIWHITSFGIGCETRLATSIDKIKLSKWLTERLIEIEELESDSEVKKGLIS